MKADKILSAMRALGILVTLVLMPACRQSSGTEIGGSVQFQGQPIDEGMIIFISLDPDRARAATVIRDGRYALPISPGRKRVEILATRTTGTQPAYEGDADSPLVDVVEQYLPKRFNEESELTCTIEQSQSDLDFSL
ncbi:hypothetical protein Pan216_51750 [Planctomycetes bacterium Pan216]|uniref:Carboxypeptidase regulatory-like domain-containing protein n=1 Tax=Kolteria novifilia TaxID=2527975 RepID=A0A518BBB3_9BACT|nr:hypothetical protein Pan216_51750 [Planctomycetes bacterium Pan216]